jgi:hypothetical protein
MSRCLFLVRAAIALAAAFAVFGLANEARPASAAVTIALSASTSGVVCGNVVSITAEVRNDGVLVTDGTSVLFQATSNASVLTTTVGGRATVTFVAPTGFVGNFVATVSSLGSAASISVPVTCITQGPPASITTLVTPTTINCGNTATVLATVRDQFGSPVANGTLVRFTVDGLGTITPTAPTIGSGGVADAVFTAFPATAGGTVRVTISAGTAPVVTTTTTINVICAAAATATRPATAIPPAVVPTAVPSTIRPPSTGEAGLK